MTLHEAIESGKPFRRPCWVESSYEFQWVVISPDYYYSLDWANIDGTSSNNIFGDIEDLEIEDKVAEDYELMDIK